MYAVSKILQRKRMMAEILREEKEEEKNMTIEQLKLHSLQGRADSIEVDSDKDQSGSEDEEDNEYDDLELDTASQIEFKKAQRRDAHHHQHVRSSLVLVPKVGAELSTMKRKLSQSERRALAATWKKLKGPSGRFVEKTMNELLDQLVRIDGTVKHVFYRAAFLRGMQQAARKQEHDMPIATMHEHTRLMRQYIECLIDYLNNNHGNLQRPESPVVLGRMHSGLHQLGLHVSTWDTFGEIWSASFSTQDCVKAYPHAQRAWNIVIAAIMDYMRVGFCSRMQAVDKPHECPSEQSPAFIPDAENDQIDECEHQAQHLASRGTPSLEARKLEQELDLDWFTGCQRPQLDTTMSRTQSKPSSLFDGAQSEKLSGEQSACSGAAFNMPGQYPGTPGRHHASRSHTFSSSIPIFSRTPSLDQFTLVMTEIDRLSDRLHKLEMNMSLNDPRYGPKRKTYSLGSNRARFMAGRQLPMTPEYSFDSIYGFGRPSHSEIAWSVHEDQMERGHPSSCSVRPTHDRKATAESTTARKRRSLIPESVPNLRSFTQWSMDSLL